MKYHFIINPKARSGMGKMVWNMLEPELKKRRVPYQCSLTSKKKHAEQIAARITSDGQEHILVVLGGDGTVNEVVNGIRQPEKATLGYIPIGSSNDFARGLNIPKDPVSALNIILNPKNIINMDLGVMEGAGRRRRFAVSAGMGFDAAVCHEVCISRWKVLLNRIGLGKLSYAVVAMDRLKKERPVKMNVMLPDGTEKVFESTYFAAFMNHPYEGGGFKFCPEASPSDGELDVIIAHGVSGIKLLFLLPLAFAGKHVGFQGVTILRCKKIQAETDRPLPLHTDGEPGFLRKKITVRLMAEQLKVIIG